MNTRFLTTILFLAPLVLGGCSSIQDGFEYGYAHSQENPIGTMNLEELAEARRTIGLKASEHYDRKALRNDGR